MHIVRVASKDELVELLEWIFFRREGEFMEYHEASLSFEEICSMLGIREEEFAPGIDTNTDEWYDIIDNLEGKDIQAKIAAGDIPLLRDFKPGTLVWCLEDDFCRAGDMDIRVFIYTTDEESSMEAHREWKAIEQGDYNARVEQHRYLAELESRL